MVINCPEKYGKYGSTLSHIRDKSLDLPAQVPISITTLASSISSSSDICFSYGLQISRLISSKNRNIVDIYQKNNKPKYKNMVNIQKKCKHGSLSSHMSLPCLRGKSWDLYAQVPIFITTLASLISNSN